MTSAEVILILIYANNDGSNIQINGPFDSCIVAAGGQLVKVSNKSIIKAAKMNRLKRLN